MRQSSLVTGGASFVAIVSLGLAACGADPEYVVREDLGGSSGAFASGGDVGAGGAFGSGGVGTGGVIGAGGTTGGGGQVGAGGFVGSGGDVGAGGFIGGGGDVGAGGLVGTGGSGPARMPPCLTSPSQGVIIGDSYVTGALSPALQPALGALYPAANQFRNYAVAGTSMANGGITGRIPPQFDQAVLVSSDIQFSIMDGGGNDILICDNVKFPGCNTVCNRAGSTSQAVCTSIVTEALAAAEALMMKAADQGVKDVIYFFYPHIPSNNGGYDEILDYSEPRAREKCEGAATATGGRLHCHFVSMIAPFAAAGGDRNPANFAPDGIHPSAAGQSIMAREIFAVMERECIGQPASSGCCAP